MLDNKETYWNKDKKLYDNKRGKTTILSTLENNLILDFEDGTTYVDALKIKIDNLATLKETIKAIKEAGKPYKYITIDTITAVEEMAKPVAISLYKRSPMYSDRYADVSDVTRLPNGSGYTFLRQAVESIVDLIASATDNIILCGHVRDLDLTGKLKRILSARSDAIGFVHRDENSNLCINFGQDGEVLTGARPKHLANKDIIVAERNEDGTFTSHWERIYPSLA